MKLSDVMSAAGLQAWAEIGLVVSFATFIALIIWLFVIRRGPVFERESQLPLHDGPITNTPAVTDDTRQPSQRPEEAPSR